MLTTTAQSCSGSAGGEPNRRVPHHGRGRLAFISPRARVVPSLVIRTGGIGEIELPALCGLRQIDGIHDASFGKDLGAHPVRSLSAALSHGNGVGSGEQLVGRFHLPEGQRFEKSPGSGDVIPQLVSLGGLEAVGFQQIAQDELDVAARQIGWPEFLLPPTLGVINGYPTLLPALYRS